MSLDFVEKCGGAVEISRGLWKVTCDIMSDFEVVGQ
jgi:hypothetical protein